MRIGIAGPIATDTITSFLLGDVGTLPRGYFGAPLLGTLIGALLERGHEVIAFTTSSDLDPDTEPVLAKGKCFRIYYCPSRRRAFRRESGYWGRAMDAFRLERAGLTRAISDDPPDIVHSHWSYEFALAALDSGLPHLITCHDAPQVVLRYMPNAYRLVRYFMARRVLAQARHLTAVSPYLKDKVAPYARVPVSVVPNPVYVGAHGGTEPGRVFNSETPRIGMVLTGWGRLKNPKPALRAFALLRGKVPYAELVLMGYDYGPGERAERWACAQGLANGVRFLGALPHQALLAVLSRIDLLLHPSLEETFGMAVAEAMALGVPAIGGDRSGAVPWVIADGGMTCDVTDPVAICSAMARIIEDKNVHAQYAARAVASVRERFGVAHVARLFEAAYTRAVNETSAHAERRCVAGERS